MPNDAPTANRSCPACGLQTDARTCPEDGAPTFAVSGFQKDALSYKPGELVNERYRITGTLGRGAFGAVYAAEHTGTKQAVALKMLTADISTVDPATIRRFYREAQITAQLTCPHTVRVFDVGQADDGPMYLVMEQLRGHTLARLLRSLADKSEVMSEAEAIDLAIPILKSLAEAHNADLVHRDLKPANIFLARMGDDETVVKVLDFGIARTQDSSLTAQGSALGTPAYMSPEQFRGQELTGASDIYSLGVMLYLCVTGRLPFVADEVFALGHMHIFEPVPDPRMVAPEELSYAFVELLNRALEKTPRDRFDDARAMRKKLERIRGGAYDSALVTRLELEPEHQALLADGTPTRDDSSGLRATPATDSHDVSAGLVPEADAEQGTVAVQVDAMKATANLRAAGTRGDDERENPENAGFSQDDPDDQAKAHGMAKLAKDTAKSGNYALAAGMFLQAYGLAPTKIAYLYSAARAEHLAWKLADAKKHYTEFLSRAPANHPLVPRTKGFLAQVDAGLKADKQVKERLSKSGKSQPPTSGAVQAQGGNTMWGMILTGTGAVTAVAGGVLLAMASTDRSALQAKVDTKNANGKITGIRYSEAKAESDAIVSAEKMSVGVIGAGVVLAGAGVVLWKLASAPQESSWMLAPTGRGFSLSARF